jgi:hypothetical protein
MTRLVGAYLDSCHRDEGEGLPKIPEQPHGAAVGQLVEIESLIYFVCLELFLVQLLRYAISSTALIISSRTRNLVLE